MTPKYEFLPGRGTHYGSRIRSFVLRNQRARKRKKSEPNVDQQLELTSASHRQQQVGVADSRNLLIGQIDPFNTFGVDMDAYENGMLQHYLNHCIPNLGKNRQPASFFPPRDVDWASIREDPMLIFAAIQFAAFSIALVESSEQGRTEKADKYHYKTLQMVRTRLEAERHRPTDKLLHVIIGLMATDTHIRRFHQSSEGVERDLELHICGLRAALNCRHGWDVPSYSTAIQWELLWQDIVVDGRLSKGMTKFSPHLQRTLPFGDCLLASSSGDEQWLYLCKLEALGAYTNMYEAAQQRIHRPVNYGDVLSPELRDLFQPGTPAYETLKSSERAVVDSVAPLLLLNIKLYSLRDVDAEEMAYQYWALYKKFRRCNVQQRSGPAYLCFAIGMSVEMSIWTDPDQMELVARMLSVRVRLSTTLQQKLQQSLLGFVTDSKEEEIREWLTPDELRNALCEDVSLNI